MKRRAARSHQATLEALPALAVALHPLAIPTTYLPRRRPQPLVDHARAVNDAITRGQLERGDQR